MSDKRQYSISIESDDEKHAWDVAKAMRDMFGWAVLYEMEERNGNETWYVFALFDTLHDAWKAFTDAEKRYSKVSLHNHYAGNWIEPADHVLYPTPSEPLSE